MVFSGDSYCRTGRKTLTETCKYFKNNLSDHVLSERNESKYTDWNSRLISSSGRKLARHADKNRYAISAPDRPTYSPNRQNAAPDVLDIFLHNIELLVDDVALN